MRLTFIFVLTLLISTSALAGDVVKKSRSDICHDSSSPYYDRTTNFRPYQSLDACLQSGGRLPKGRPSPSYAQATPQTTLTARYDRDLFPHWSRQDGCINTRHALLRELSTGPVTMSRNGCSVIHGRWIDPYTGVIFTNPRELQIDHVVALFFAWQHGDAQNWSMEKREMFANDKMNLLAVKGSVNQAKGAAGLLDWLPPRPAYHCQYALRFVRVLIKYDFDRNLIDTHKKRQQELCAGN